MKTLIQNGILVDPLNDIREKRNILIEDDIVVSTDANDVAADWIIDASGLTILPGFVDLHVHFRDPGLTDKEDLLTGSMAAARGGVSYVCTMPNTKPAQDSASLVADAISRGEKNGYAHILPVGAITKGQDGKELVDFEALRNAGAVAFSEDGKSVMDILLYKEGIEKIAALDMPIMAHCEDKNLVQGGVINKGDKSLELGLPGITNSVEDVITARDIFLCGDANARLHLCHISTKSVVEMVRMAKKLGLNVTAEACPHHFCLADKDIPSDDANWKMNPPLRSEEDRLAIIEGLRDGTIECISTDHAPHTEEEKKNGFMGSPFGIIGLETSFQLAYTYLVKTGVISLEELVRKMTVNPAKVLGIDAGTISVGSKACFSIWSLNERYVINKEDIVSKGKNTPFIGTEVYGVNKYTFFDGRMVYPFL